MAAQSNNPAVHEPSIPETNVKVCVRCRRMLPQELAAGSMPCVRINSHDREISIGADRRWQFDEVFDQHATQQDMYNSLVRNLIDGCFAGINATVFACTSGSYHKHRSREQHHGLTFLVGTDGQTGSGKTYTMGTAAVSCCPVTHIFV